jgi:hypothetical protein
MINGESPGTFQETDANVSEGTIGYAYVKSVTPQTVITVGVPCPHHVICERNVIVN